MNREARAGTVIVVGHDSMRAARVEAGLHDLGGWSIHVCKPRQLRALAEDRPGAIILTVLSDVETRRMLRDIAAWPRSPTLIALSDAPDKLWTSAFREVGLRAALPACSTTEEIVAAVRALRAGLLVIHPKALVPSAAGAPTTASGAPLTAREREILEMMADGAHNRTIAARLGISRHTVKFHVASILAKLGAESRTEAVALALRGGLLAV
jgi:DNA-binding NarL/FixJ family response regulator